MSSTKQAQTDEWRPERVHNVLRRFRRGPDKTRRFMGQQQGETIRRVVRAHPIFYVWALVPMLLSLVFLGLVVWLETRNVVPSAFFPILYLIGGIALIGSVLYGAYRIFEQWWVNIDIVTNKRVLTWHGLLKVTRDETSLDKVQQVAVEQDSLAGIILSYGTVRVYLAGGKFLYLKNVRDPKGVRDDIEGITQSYRDAKPAKAPPPPPNDPVMAATLETLGKKDPLPKLPNADAKLEHRRSPNKVRGPLRRFGGPLRVECDVHYDAEEYTVMYIQRSWWLLAVRLVLPILLLVATLVGALIARVLFGLFAVAFVVMLVAIGLVIIGYIDDVFILTNKRIIDINRKLIILSEQHDTTTYDKIAKIEVKSPNVVLLALSIGNLYIETQGANPNIHMRHIAHPFFVQDKISEIKGFKDKADKTKNANDRKAELTMWFNTVLSKLETKVANRGVPNLQSLDLWTAVERASQFGMRVVPIGESTSYPNVESGKIVMQIPPPGTPVDTDEKPQIQVILSKRK
jgi:Bacterial PH domain/PASTA domain